MSAPLSPAEQAVADEEARYWGKWRAKGPIYIDGALAAVKGHDVPTDLVSRYRLEEEDLVEPFHGPDDTEAVEEAPKPPEGQVIEGKPEKSGK